MRTFPAALALGGLAALALLLLVPPAQAAAGLENPALLEERGPIRIDGDAFFTPEFGVRGGNGTPEDPFLIAHWRIRSDEVHVRVGNATKAFVVRNLDLEGRCASASPCLTEAGIVVNRSRVGGLVLHNQIKGMDRAGIHVEESPDVEVVENLVEGGGTSPQGAGIQVRLSPRSEVRGNHVLAVGPPSSTAAAAVRIWSSDDTLVAGNEIRGATDEGLNLLGSRRVEVVDNTITGSRYFGVLASGPDALLHYNTITDTSGTAITVNSGFLHLANNDFGFNRRGLEIIAGRNNVTLRNNNFQGHTDFALRLTANASADARDNFWGPTGPNVNGTGPGSGETVVLFQTTRDRLVVQPFLTQRVTQAGAFALRATRTVVAGDPGTADPGGSGGGPGGVQDPAPRAVFEGPSHVVVGEEASFSAARSFDPEGGALRYLWDLGDNATDGGLRARHVYNRTGEYVVRLTVTDPTGLSGTASIALRVDRPTLAVRLVVNETVARRQDVVLHAVVTGQGQGPLAFRFTTGGPGTFGGEGGPSNRSTVRFEDPGDYLVGVEVQAGSEVRTAFERVRVVNRPPVPVLSVEPEQGDSRTTFRLNADLSSDPDGDDLTYTWDLGGGATVTGNEVQRTFPSGLHVLSLTVSDGAASATVQRALNVAPAESADGANPAPAPGALLGLGGVVLAALAARFRPRR